MTPGQTISSATVSGALGSLALVAACAASGGASTEAIAPGELNLAPLEGSRIPAQCTPLEFPGRNSAVIGCVTFELRSTYRGAVWEHAYIAALREHRWRVWSGAGNEYWLEREVANTNCSDRLDMVVWIAPTAEERAALEAGTLRFEDVQVGTIHFVKHNRQYCGDDRPWVRTSQ